ncbi:MAG: hypothetical protein H3C62_01760 [Gemmatimonadaceae bacterium]|nr:hypothetical protein [Gemmatimonadaceae bacterium]
MVRITQPGIADYGQVQVEIVSAGVRNPTSQFSIGTTPRHIGEGVAEVYIDTSSLRLGVYEVGLVRLHSPQREQSDQHRDFLPTRDYERQIFEIRDTGGAVRNAAELTAFVRECEQQIVQAATATVDVRSDKSSEGLEYIVLVFVRDVLIGVSMLVDTFQVVPTGTGLDGADSIRFVNEFLAETTRFGIRFAPDEASIEQVRQNNPVFVSNFPSIRANAPEEARDHCLSRAERLMLAFALSRDAGGSVLEVIVIPKGDGLALRYGYTGSYVGNLLQGSMSGESAEQVEAYLRGLEANELNRFLVSLYREALRERSPDFRYVRFWQILETLADSRNYDEAQPLLDYEGRPMMEDGQALRVKGSVNSVFNLLRENSIGTTSESWKQVNVWFAFRCAAAHYGSMAKHAQLSKSSTRRWGRTGFDELQSSPGFDHFLFLLKEETKLLLMRRLVDHHAAGDAGGAE